MLTTSLVTIAAVVTPLGLYETTAPDKVPTLVDFHYVQDKSALGAGTAYRPSQGFSRICYGGDVACPNSDQEVTLINVTLVDGDTGEVNYAPYGYDTRIPRRYFNFLESGVSGSKMNRSVSSTFDIQWRTWTTSVENATDVSPGLNSSYFNNGSAYVVGAYRSLTNILLNDAWDVVEGLVVDSKNGGVGFRNHTVPSQPLPYGAQWSEDLLFVEPVTECVNLNVSLDFSLNSANYSNSLRLANARLVDHGGFVDFDRKGLPFVSIGNQTDPLLFQRAQAGAWISNMLMMLVWNVTDRAANGSETIAPPFTYLNSEHGKEIVLPTAENDNTPASPYLNSYNSLLSHSYLGTFFETITPLPESGSQNGFNYTHLPPNPYNYGWSNISALGKMPCNYRCLTN
jgi:hypothetical protein